MKKKLIILCSLVFLISCTSHTGQKNESVALGKDCKTLTHDHCIVMAAACDSTCHCEAYTGEGKIQCN